MFAQYTEGKEVDGDTFYIMFVPEQTSTKKVSLRCNQCMINE